MPLLRRQRRCRLASTITTPRTVKHRSAKALGRSYAVEVSSTNNIATYGCHGGGLLLLLAVAAPVDAEDDRWM